MGYNDKNMIKDLSGKTYVPQYFNPITNQWEAVEGDVGAQSVQLPPVTDFRNGAVSVGSVTIELKADTTALSGRRQLIVYPPTAGTIYWGTNTVTTLNGAPLNAGDAPLVFDFSPSKPVSIFAVSDGTNRDIRVVESK